LILAWGPASLNRLENREGEVKREELGGTRKLERPFSRPGP